ncbi:TOG array regulator of axonemal microtubules protein 1 isoform X1 [Drosophila miranda]|uniref:TOG array regulator of axonemal microtubules protein 1 isoform X1 n=1 Tax=Drosophila miranda TaxID=7229 RepID=UPI0007E814D8|nr:TOG array regulator of axonemal microtubules protein 1 isoform X1 [Drosophila miranda]
MFFRRILERKDGTNSVPLPIATTATSAANSTRTPMNDYNSEASESVTYVSGTTGSEVKDKNNNQSASVGAGLLPLTKMQRRTEAPIGAVQLTPLWEHILRTRRLPETICPTAMYAEFHERLQDPEWQVRQHALRVLVDVLVVMQDRADNHMEEHQLIGLLVENLGHQAPTVRKGALDCLRVYLAETAIPESVVLKILDTGLTPMESDHGRLSCGVLLSLPAILQSILHTPQRHFIVQQALQRVVEHLDQLAQQEITLKVLSKMREILGVHEFEAIMNAVCGHTALSKYYQLCQVYGVCEKPNRAGEVKTGAWRALPREQSWRSSSSSIHPLDSSLQLQQPSCSDKGKVIMETEIKINDDTVTMRLLEADTETEEYDSPARVYSKDIEPTELVCRALMGSARSHQDLREGAGIVQVISDSELDEHPTAGSETKSEPSTPSRGLKRVTFGGEIVKMRTPDSDAAISSNNYKRTGQPIHGPAIITLDDSSGSPRKFPIEGEPVVSIPSALGDSKTSALVVEIPYDNTKPLPLPFSSQSVRPQSNVQADQSTTSPSSYSSPKHQTEESKLTPPPQSPLSRSRSTSPAGSNNISPKVPHKQIEVLHNLQRDPSPRSLRRIEDMTESVAVSPSPSPTQSLRARTTSIMSAESPVTPKSWEDLDIVNYKTLMDLRSGDWRHRLQGFSHLELALSSSGNLAQVQPYLDSLLRTLLSSERHFDIAELKRELLVNLITRLPLDNLEERTLQILTGLCRQGTAGANRVCKALMQRLPAGTIVAKLTAPEFMHAKSSKFRDHALQMSIFALMTFPGTCFDINLLTAQTIYSSLNRKRRVRQAALEVLAVLADISSVQQVLAIVSEMAAGVELGPLMLDATRMRLSRLQLPIITPDSSVLFIFNQTEKPGNRRGADIDWINQGDGSASPNAIKRRRMRAASRQRVVQESTEAKDRTETLHSFTHVNESLHRHSFHSPPETLDIATSPNDFSQRLSFGARTMHGNLMDRRMVGKTCSDTSMDGRSTDSTATTCSSGSTGSFIQLTSRTGSHLSGPSSRFPAMNQHTDFVNNFMRSMQRSTTSYTLDGQAYPKVSYTNPTKSHQSQMLRKKLQHQHAFTLSQQSSRTRNTGQAQDGEILKTNEIRRKQQRSFSIDNLQSPHTLGRECAGAAKPDASVRIGADPETVRSSTLGSQTDKGTTDGSPLSVKSTSYSQKSTASAKSSNSHCEMDRRPTSPARSGESVDKKMEVLSLERNAVESFGELVVDDIVSNIEEETEHLPPEDTLKRNESVNSLHSKTESIKTQLEDVSPQLSRAQSTKSLPIEEDIEGSNSFVVVEEVQHELEATPTESSPLKQLEEPLAANEMTTSANRTGGSFTSKSGPLHDNLVMQPRSISLESLYGVRPASKQGSLDNTSTSTTDNTSQSGSQMGNITVRGKTQHTPLKQKSKTSYFLRGQRRVSPVKQAIKISQAELFPQNMSRFEKPREALHKTFDQLDSSNWEMNIVGLKSTVRLIRCHADFLDSHMHMTCIQLTRSVRNLRSQVARASCQAAAELFSLKSKYLEQECDDLVCALLHRTADTNRFIRADATHALESMVDHAQPVKVLNILATKGAQHQNALVRTSTSKLLFRLVERLGSDRIYAMGRESRDKFFVVGANLLLEGSLETRSYAKSLFRALSEHSSYQRLLLEVIPSRTYRNVEKTLRSITR